MALNNICMYFTNKELLKINPFLMDVIALVGNYLKYQSLLID
jgi:hypothetical protein